MYEIRAVRRYGRIDRIRRPSKTVRLDITLIVFCGEVHEPICAEYRRLIRIGGFGVPEWGGGAGLGSCEIEPGVGPGVAAGVCSLVLLEN